MNKDRLSMKAGENQRIKKLAGFMIDPSSPFIPAERRKTLITEQDSFIVLKKVVTTNFPKKKYNALMPNEYTKYILETNGIKINGFPSNKYNYPPSVLSNSQIDEIKILRKLRNTCNNSSPAKIKTFIY